MKQIRNKTAFITGILLILSLNVHSQEIIKLPAPKTEGGMPLMQALKERKSGREFSSKKLSPETLSSLLWAAWGINRPDGKRTAPSARNLQDLDVYLAVSDGVYLYDAKDNQLKKILSGDIGAATGTQDYVKDAALNLIYVSDLAKLNLPDEKAVEFFTGTHTGFLVQNVYLFCASEGLATVVRGSVDKEKLSKIMKLREDQKITLVQSVGYPAEK